MRIEMRIAQAIEHLEAVIGDRPLVIQMGIVSDVLLRLSELVLQRAEESLAAWEQKHRPTDVLLSADDLAGLIISSTEVDVSEFLIEAPPIPRWRSPLRVTGGEGETEAFYEMDEEKAAFLKELPPPEPLRDEEIERQLKALAYDEDISGWIAAVGQYLQHRWASLSRRQGASKAVDKGGIPLLELPAAVGLPLSKVWLSLLLGEGGGRLVQESADFYDAAGVRVMWSEGEVK
ncbi:hypothetical protein K9N68_38605 (plasmid) [Kovacikia minuta CCNUW1]|uniref:hypothetical protein n=1 Tax=Kovacikia minuta TaxID=2931930 RepID=UPI001CCBDE5A|nr:hypothetical protein [Kovacikia minuta]UBF30095.1 hypothetical protein K9N68_38605 [Kovacikia minuta CCNUW1]